MEEASVKPGEPSLAQMSLRGVLGGGLMGVANLVPGISGGTMLLASGVYPGFIGAIADITTFRFRIRSVVLLASVIAAAGLAILFMAGGVKDLVVHQRWIMYSLFIGLTLGGAPVVWRMAGRASAGWWAGAIVGCTMMAGLAWAQAGRAGGAADQEGRTILLFLAGLAGSSAMILPGVSGGYLLLVLGQYVPILSAIDRFKDAVQTGAWGTVVDIGFGVGVPVGLGVVAGIIGVSHGLKWLLDRAPKVTLGVLLGLLLGAVWGLWPFQEGVPPKPGAVLKGEIMTAERIAEIDPEDYPAAYFRPTAGQAAAAVALIMVGFAGTSLIARVGGETSNLGTNQSRRPGGERAAAAGE
jgi:putative membrane protein